MHIHEVVIRYGVLFYPLIFMWTFLEGETIVIFSGAAAKSGYVNLEALIIVAWMGSFLGDQTWFLASRYFGKHYIKGKPALEKKIAIVTRLLEDNSIAFILTYRFIYGVRNIASVAIGASHISWLKFSCLNFISSGIWALAFSLGGFFAGSAMKKIFGEATQTAGIVLLVTFVIVGGYFFFRYRKNTKNELAEVNDPASET